MNKLGNKIKEIRLKEGLSQEAFAKELGYTSKSTINKIEKGINEISYDKLMLLIKKYELEMDELFDKNYQDIFSPTSNNSNIFVSFSARNNGNSIDIANHLMKDEDRIILFKDIFYNPCSKCNYECFKGVCKYHHDDIYELIDTMNKYNKIVFIVPMYSSNPSSLYFILSERMQEYFNHNEKKWKSFVNKLHVVCVYGSDNETPYFTKTFINLGISEENILKIERHKYNLKMQDKIIDNMNFMKQIKEFKTKLN